MLMGRTEESICVSLQGVAPYSHSAATKVRTPQRNDHGNTLLPVGGGGGGLFSYLTVMPNKKMLFAWRNSRTGGEEREVWWGVEGCGVGVWKGGCVDSQNHSSSD